MSEKFPTTFEIAPPLKVDIEKEYQSFAPEDFKKDPFKYFEEKGINIKPGEVQYKDWGEVKEDPTAVKLLPKWTDENGNEITPVGKKVNIVKAQIGKQGDPFYEFNIMKQVRDLGLPAANPIAKAQQGEHHLIVMEKASGFNIYEAAELLKQHGFVSEDVVQLKAEAEAKMEDLRNTFEATGIHRKWKLQDMVFDIDLENRTIRSITPIDWERTVIKK